MSTSVAVRPVESLCKAYCSDSGKRCTIFKQKILDRHGNCLFKTPTCHKHNQKIYKIYSNAYDKEDYNDDAFIEYLTNIHIVNELYDENDINNILTYCTNKDIDLFHTSEKHDMDIDYDGNYNENAKKNNKEKGKKPVKQTIKKHIPKLNLNELSNMLTQALQEGESSENDNTIQINKLKKEVEGIKQIIAKLVTWIKNK